MRFPPPSVVATWPPPNYVDPVKRGPALLIVELISLPLAVICVSLRLYVRIRMLRRAWWDDWLMVGATVFGSGVTTCFILATQRYAWNIHVWDATEKQLIQGRQVSIAGQTLFLFASGLGKLSIIFSYLRIAPQDSIFRRAIYVAIAFMTASIFGFLTILWAQCHPSKEYWDLFATDRQCVPEGPPVLSQAIVTVFVDIMVYVLPMPTLYKLRLPVVQRVGLMILFGFGSVVIIASIMRTYWIYHVVYQTYDVTWEGFDLWIWTAVEANLGVICGCVPSLKVLVWPRRSRKRLYGSGPNEQQTVGSFPKSENIITRGIYLDLDKDMEMQHAEHVEDEGDSASTFVLELVEPKHEVSIGTPRQHDFTSSNEPPMSLPKGRQGEIHEGP